MDVSTIDSRDTVVTRRSALGNQTRLSLGGGRSLLARRFVPLGEGDHLVERANGLAVRLNDGSELPIEPAWQKTTAVHIGDSLLRVSVKEIESKAELAGFDRLTRYHYRGTKGAGRTVPLVAVIHHDELPEVIGFIELATCFLVNTARQKVFDSVFADPDRGVGWLRWDGLIAKRWINCIARISRCVVFPELRGLGLSSVLAEAAVEYARSRWHVGGTRPSFLEITADMLRYWPFVKKSGFLYIGETEGNEHRAAKDMRYLLKKSAAGGGNGTQGMPRGGGGILSLQRSYALHLGAVVRRTNLSLDQIISYLKTSPDKLSDEQWLMLHKVYRRPKPTFMRGLTPAAEKFLKRRTAVAKTRATESELVKGLRKPSRQTMLEIRGLTITAHAKPVPSGRARKVQEAFGIVADMIDVSVVEGLDLTIRAGEIIMVTGPSGSGKSLLLDAIKSFAGYPPVESPSGEVNVSGELRGQIPRVFWPVECEPQTSPIDALKDLSVEEALHVLAVAGLAEPQLFVRPSSTLSLGQKYRLAIAMGLAQNPEVFLVDEFCEPLDQFSTAAVGRRIRQEATARGMSVIAATSRPKPIASVLKPDRILVLASDGGFAWR